MLKKVNYDDFVGDYKPALAEEYEREEKKVKSIINDIRINKDKALKKYIEMYDNYAGSILVTEEEIEEALGEVPEQLILDLEDAAQNIEKFHKKQLKESWIAPDENGTILGYLNRPLSKVGCYAPGGVAAYPSSVLMTVVTAKVAGVKEVYLCTPPGSNGKIEPATLCAAKIAGATKVFKAGGAQAIAALAYGTETIPRVDKIVGPGNLYVALAKKMVYGDVGIDMLAGPSEVMVLADENSTPAFIAADLLAQAEHGAGAAVYLVTNSDKMLSQVDNELKRQLEELSRKDVIINNLQQYAAAIRVSNMEEGIKTVNLIAPEHLGLHVKSPWDLLGQIQNAGTICIGEYTPEAVGDYFAGTNHVLPTGGAARFSAPLSVDDFQNRSGLLYYTRKSLAKDAAKIERLAKAEGFQAHANSVTIRGDKDEGKNS